MESPTSFKQQPQQPRPIQQAREQTILATTSDNASSFFSKYKWWLIGGGIFLAVFLIVRWKFNQKSSKDAGDEEWDEFENDRDTQSQHAAYDGLDAPPISSGLSAAEHAVLQRNRQAHQQGQQTQGQQQQPFQHVQPQQQPHNNGHIGGAMPTQPVSQYPSIQQHVMTPQQPTSPAQHVMPAPQTTYNQPQYTGQIYQGQGQQSQNTPQAPMGTQPTAAAASPPMMGAGSGNVPFNGEMPTGQRESQQAPQAQQGQQAPGQVSGFSMDTAGSAEGMPSGFSPL